MNGKTTVSIHGKEYEIVASRINRFRNDFPAWSITTEILKLEGGECCIKASILDDKGVVRATGIAHEKESSSTINKTSYVECCESSALGRALACFNYQGGEYASADEVATAIANQVGGKIVDDSHKLRTEEKPEPKVEAHFTHKISEKQGKRLWAIMKGANVAPEILKGYLKEKYSIDHIADITIEDYDRIIQWVEGYNLSQGLV